MHKFHLLNGKLVVITGASAGIGRACAVAFAKEGARVILLARGMEGLNSAKLEIEALGAFAAIYNVDVSHADKIEAIINEVEVCHGPIDILVNNVMCSVFGEAKNITAAEYKRVTEVTYLGQVYPTLAVLNKMLHRNCGKIIFIGSSLAYRGIPLQSAYCGAKHAIKGFFESLRTELIHDKAKVKLTMIQLPAINTPQFGWVMNKLPFTPKPMGKVYQPEVAARAVIFAALHDRREIYVGLPTFQTIIGNKFLPGFLDWYLAKIGYQGQQTSQKKLEHSPDNIWEPILEDRGTHGEFSAIAHRKSILLWLVMNKNYAFLLVLIVMGFMAFFLYKVF